MYKIKIEERDISLMKREEILEQLWAEQDRAYDLMEEYDSLPHHYGEDVLYQAEAYVVHEIGKNPNTTTTELASVLNKTTSACSQLIKKLVTKGLVEQIRNEDNKRVYNLKLTSDGERVYKDHIEFNKMCQKITFDMLNEFSDEELMIHTKIQRMINQSYANDVSRSKEYYGEE